MLVGVLGEERCDGARRARLRCRHAAANQLANRGFVTGRTRFLRRGVGYAHHREDEHHRSHEAAQRIFAQNLAWPLNDRITRPSGRAQRSGSHERGASAVSFYRLSAVCRPTVELGCEGVQPPLPFILRCCLTPTRTFQAWKMLGLGQAHIASRLRLASTICSFGVTGVSSRRLRRGRNVSNRIERSSQHAAWADLAGGYRRLHIGLSVGFPTERVNGFVNGIHAS